MVFLLFCVSVKVELDMWVIFVVIGNLVFLLNIIVVNFCVDLVWSCFWYWDILMWWRWMMFLILCVVGRWEMLGWNKMYLRLVLDLVMVGFISISIEYILVFWYFYVGLNSLIMLYIFIVVLVCRLVRVV